MPSSHVSAHRPSYDKSLSAYQRAFAAELRQIVGCLPLTKDMRVLDVPCGNGFYSRFLAERLGRRGEIDCVDLCPAYLASVRRKLKSARCAWDVLQADVYRLPFADETFDVIWCAQSFISLSDPRSALREMKRVLRRGGTLAVLENDVFHHILLPWPVDLEVPVQRAILRVSRDRFGSSTKLAPVRRLPQLFDLAGFKHCRKRTFAADRQAPWPLAVRRFLSLHVADRRKLIERFLSPALRKRYQRFVDATRADGLFGDKAMDITCLNVLYEAT